MPRSIIDAVKNYNPKTPAQQRVKAFMLTNIDQLASLSFDDIAQMSSVSQPTVTRVVRNMGFENSHSLRAAAAAAARPLLGRPDLERVVKAAAIMRKSEDIFIFAPAEMDPEIVKIFKNVFPKDVRLPMKPNILARKNPAWKTPQRFQEDDCALIIAIRSLPAGWDFETEIKNACDNQATVIVLQATDFELREKIPQSCRERVQIISLGLADDVHDDLAIIMLAAAIIEIRQAAAVSA
jgi:hypothetical protein